MKKVLVIDDCEEFREVVFDLLEDAGYEVQLAGGAAGAIELCEKEKFDIVLCDLVLPTECEFEDDHDSFISNKKDWMKYTKPN